MIGTDSNGWTQQDYATLIKTSVAGFFQPEHWLQFCTNESGLLVSRPCKQYPNGSGPFAKNPNANARGLWQAMGSILINLGFKAGDPDHDAAGGDFREVPVARQIVWSGKYLEGWRKQARLQQWNSAGDLYLCNFTPAYLRHRDDPSYILFDGRIKAQESTYRVNAGLDHGRKGWIDVKDMTLAVQGAQGTSVYKQAIRSLNKMVQEGLNDRGFGVGLNKTGKGDLVVDGDLGYFSQKALGLFWDAKGFDPGDRKVDSHTRFSLL